MASKRKRVAEGSEFHDWMPGTGIGMPDASECCGNACESAVGKPPQSFDERAVRKELANMIILHKYPLSIVDDVGFRNYSRCLNPHFKTVFRSQVQDEISRAFDTEKPMRQSVLRNNVGRIAVSMDLWTSHGETRKYVAATAHFIDDSWTLQNFLFEFRKLPLEYTEEQHMETYLECLYDWNLDGELSTLTYDDCFDDEFIKKAYSTRLDLEEFILGGKFLRMRCFALTLNSLVGEGLSALGAAIMKIRDSVDYWTATPQRHRTFICLAKDLCGYRCQGLVRCCETQWDSMYSMLETALSYRDAFKNKVLRNRYPSYTCIPSEEDWNLTKKVCERLKLFSDTSVLFSGKNYRTGNEYFQKVCDIKLALSEWAASEIEVVRDMASKMVQKFDEYWTEVNTLLAVAAILDPRYKMYVVEYYFRKIYKDGAQGEIDRVRKICCQLFEEYRTRIKSMRSTLRGKKNNEHAKEDPMSAFDSFVAERKKNSCQTVTNELDYYLDEDVLSRDDAFDILSWWKVDGLKYPTLRMMARDVLAIPISKVISDAAFSTVGRVLDRNFNKLCPDIVQALMCKRNWMAADFPVKHFLHDVQICSNYKPKFLTFSCFLDVDASDVEDDEGADYE